MKTTINRAPTTAASCVWAPACSAVGCSTRAGRDGEAAEHARGSIGRADRGHLLAAVDVTAVAGRKGARQDPGVSEGDERDTQRRADQRTEVTPRQAAEGGRRQSSG